MTRFGSLLVLGFSLLPSAAAAQEPPQVALGAHVRVWTSPTSAPLTGIVVAQDATSLTLAGKGFDKPFSVTRSTITRFDLSGGRRSRGKTMLYGMLIGFGAAMTVGLLSGDDPPNTFLRFTAAEKGLFVSILAVPAGALVGAIVGPGPERWTTTTPPSKGSLLLAPPTPSVRFSFRF